jgi:hypothetical protein
MEDPAQKTTSEFNKSRKSHVMSPAPFSPKRDIFDLKQAFIDSCTNSKLKIDKLMVGRRKLKPTSMMFKNIDFRAYNKSRNSNGSGDSETSPRDFGSPKDAILHFSR